MIERYIRDVVLTSFPVLDYNREAADWHGFERARLTSIGKTPPFVDGQIAAIAFVNDLILVTSNVRDFDGFRGLRVQNWTRSGREAWTHHGEEHDSPSGPPPDTSIQQGSPPHGGK